MGISSNIMKSPSAKCYMTFWDMTIYNDTLNWWDITPICEFITELDFNSDFDLITEFWGFHRTLQRVRLANRGRLLLRTPGPVPFGTCICSNVETILSLTCHVYGPFEHPSVLLFCLAIYVSLHTAGQSLLIISCFNLSTPSFFLFLTILAKNLWSAAFKIMAYRHLSCTVFPPLLWWIVQLYTK